MISHYRLIGIHHVIITSLGKELANYNATNFTVHNKKLVELSKPIEVCYRFTLIAKVQKSSDCSQMPRSKIPMSKKNIKYKVILCSMQ